MGDLTAGDFSQEEEHADEDNGGEIEQEATMTKRPLPSKQGRNTKGEKSTKKPKGDALENELLREAIAAMKTPEHDDEESVFGKLIASELCSISNVRSRQFVKLQIQNLLFEARFGTRGISPVLPCSMLSALPAPTPAFTVSTGMPFGGIPVMGAQATLAGHTSDLKATSGGSTQTPSTASSEVPSPMSDQHLTPSPQVCTPSTPQQQPSTMSIVSDAMNIY